MEISREYFSMLDYAVTKLTGFYRSLQIDPIIVDNVKKHCPWLYNEDHGLRFVLLSDVIKCYKDLGYSTDMDTLEGLGLFMLTFEQGKDKDGIHDYDRLQYLLAIGKDASKELISILEGQLLRVNNGTLMALVLEGSDKSLAQRYYVLLYRFMSVVAKADGTVTQEESEYLAKLLACSVEVPTDMGKPFIKVTPEDARKIQEKNDANTRRYFESSKPHPNFNELDNLPAMKELDSLIGLAGVKEEIHGLANFARVMQLRKQEGLKTTPLSLHCVFTGNPGTGKTTVARILGKIYHFLGLLNTSKFVETDRAGLVAEYIGQTAVKTNKVIDSALDGVLFIDEAYSLVSGDKSDYGLEAISTLLKRMEDNRDRLVIILAGYTDNMEEFIQANPGLRSRFSRTIKFEDYNEEELFQIFELNLKKYEYVLDPAAVETVRETIRQAAEGRDKEFGNARYIRNIFEKVIQNQANRVAYIPRVTAEDLTLIKEEDVHNLPLR